MPTKSPKLIQSYLYVGKGFFVSTALRDDDIGPLDYHETFVFEWSSDKGGECGRILYQVVTTQGEASAFMQHSRVCERIIHGEIKDLINEV